MGRVRLQIIFFVTRTMPIKLYFKIKYNSTTKFKPPRSNTLILTTTGSLQIDSSIYYSFTHLLIHLFWDIGTEYMCEASSYKLPIFLLLKRRSGSSFDFIILVC